MPDTPRRRALAYISPADFTEILIGRSRLVLTMQEYASAPEGYAREITTRELDLTDSIVMDASFDAATDTFDVVIEGPGMPVWQRGFTPQLVEYRVDRLSVRERLQEAAARLRRGRRTFDLDDEGGDR